MGGVKTGEDYERFLGEVVAALGWGPPPSGARSGEEAILAEIRRLREEVGEGDRRLRDMEHLVVARVNRVGGGPTPLLALRLTTRAGVAETHTRSQGGPWTTEFVEQPERNLVLMMEPKHAREVHDILADGLDRLDA